MADPALAWIKRRRRAEDLTRLASRELSVACRMIMPHPEVASMDAAYKALEGVLCLLELTGPRPRGRARLVAKALVDKRKEARRG